MTPTAIVMNMFYTGLGIARSLGVHDLPVIGLTSKRIYGNYTRYARVLHCPDSRDEPERLLPFMLHLGAGLACRGVVFPTRDDDVLFLDCYREELSRHFDLVIPSSPAVTACLDKWATYLRARAAGIECPASWLVRSREDLARTGEECRYPCVMKPLSSHLWRKEDNWNRVGARKAISISSAEELRREYEKIELADARVLVQEMVPGGDDELFVAACYLDRESNVIAAFTARKLLQIPAGFGTGCIVETVDCPSLIESATRLLRSIQFSGVAEVEYKWDTAAGCFKLIEINPRPWDQHGLGHACGIDLMHIAWCDFAGLPRPALRAAEPGRKWIAEDAFLMAALRSFWVRDSAWRQMFRLVRGKRTYAIWSARDIRPMVMFLASFVPRVLRLLLRQVNAAIHRRFRTKTSEPLAGRLNHVNTKV